MSDQKCEDRIEKELGREVNRLKAIFRRQELIDEWSFLSAETWQKDIVDARRYGQIDRDDARELWDELTELDNDSDMGETIDDYTEGILSIDKKTIVTVQLSWGGPADKFEVEIDDGEIGDIWYVFQDWFDGARRRLTGDDYDTVRQMLDYLYLEGLE